MSNVSKWVNDVHTMDAFDLLDQLPKNSVHAVVTDIPYNSEGGNGLNGRNWDAVGSPREYQNWCREWTEEAMRVLKPGGHLFVFSASDGYHRVASGIEDAGCSIEEQIDWLYARGMPKGHNQAPKIDDLLGKDGEYGDPKTERYANNLETGSAGTATEPYNSEWLSNSEAVERNAREYLPDSEKAKRFDGWKRDLKPGHEPICVARNPISEQSIAQNLIEHGTGALNINGARIPAEDKDHDRYPADVVVDADLDIRDVDGAEKSRYFYCSKATKKEKTLNGKIANGHPTVKPLDLMEWLVTLATAPGQIVLDMFAGSGTTGAAARNTDRQFILGELDDGFSDVARARCGLTVQNPQNVMDDDAQAAMQAFASE